MVNYTCNRKINYKPDKCDSFLYAKKYLVLNSYVQFSKNQYFLKQLTYFSFKNPN